MRTETAAGKRTLQLTTEQKMEILNAARRASRLAGRRVSPAEILAKILSDEGGHLWEISAAYFKGSPRERAARRREAERLRHETREARAFLRAESRKLLDAGVERPYTKACEALAKKLGCPIGFLRYEVRPPEWDRNRWWNKQAPGWWHTPMKAGWLRRFERDEWNLSRQRLHAFELAAHLNQDMERWEGFREEISAAESARREARLRADVKHEAHRIDGLAKRRGLRVTNHCAKHWPFALPKSRLFRCEYCARPTRGLEPLNGWAYAYMLRTEIFGRDLMRGDKEPRSMKRCPRRMRRR